MHERYTEHTRSLIEAILHSPGETPSALRCASKAHAAQLSGRASSQASQLPPEVEQYLSKVALHAYKVTDEDIEALRTAGYSEDAIFELTLSAALGAGMARLERGMAALKGETNATQED
jgi:alkylhydroperoxidase family enzyme